MAKKKGDATFEKFSGAAKQYQDALGYAPSPAVDKLAQSINKLAKDNNVLITYEIRELPATKAAARPGVSCVCVCTCHIDPI